jgi:hypothetical protein
VPCICLNRRHFRERITSLNQSSIRLGTKAAAAYLGGISEDTLRYWRYERTGPRSYRLGRRCYYDVADLDAWVAEQKSVTAVGGVK